MATRRWKSAFLPAPDGVALHYRRSVGPGRCWVFLHGFADSGSTWDRVGGRMPAHADLVLIDARNHGRSGRGPGGHQRQVADVIAVLERLDVDAPVVVGHSIGARTATGVAAARPDLVGRLVLLDPPWRDGPGSDSGPDPDRLAAVRQEISGLCASSPSQLLRLARSRHPDWDAADYPAWVESKQQTGAAAAADLTPVPWRPLAGTLAVPTLLVHGDPTSGGIVTGAVARAFAALARDVTVHHVAGRGHHLHREDLDQAVAILTAAGKPR